MFSTQLVKAARKLCTGAPARRTLTTAVSRTEENMANSYYAIKLNNKSLLRVTGDGSFIYLQSLLTNDMRRLLPKIENDETSHENLPSIYSYILSSANRVLCDLFVYRSNSHRYNTEFILEVDNRLASAVKRLLLGYNLTRDIKVERVRDIELWSILPFTSFLNHSWRNPTNEADKRISTTELNQIDSDDLKLIADPRLGSSTLGYRLLTRLDNKAKPEDISKYLSPQALIEQGKVSDYIRLKYLQGVSEGYDDIRSGFYFPFELNGDFLDAIRLDKGLFTSEEKVMQIYSKDPIKRRIVPLRFKCSSDAVHKSPPAPSTEIRTKVGSKRFGELRACIGRHGIASLRVPMVNNYDIKDLLFPSSQFPNLYHYDTGIDVEVRIPNWWPEFYDTLYLDSPDYPLCLFNLKEPIQEQKFEFLQADDAREQIAERN